MGNDERRVERICEIADTTVASDGADAAGASTGERIAAGVLWYGGCAICAD